MKNIKKLKNGLNVIFYPMPNTHSVTVGLYVRAGSLYENPDNNGVTHFLEHLHFRRAGALSQEELYNKTESMGSALRGLTCADFMKFHMKLLPEQLFGALDIFKHIIQAERWTPEEFQKERQVVINQLLEKGDYRSIEREMAKCVFQGTPLERPISGTMDNLLSFTQEEVKACKQKTFHKNNMLLCITGNVAGGEWQKARRELSRWEIPDGEAQAEPAPPQRFHRRRPEVAFCHTSDENLLQVSLSFDISIQKKEEASLTLISWILGDGLGARLQKRIREELGYASDIYSEIERYRSFAALHIWFSVEKTRFLDCLVQVVDVVKSMKRSITAADLAVTLPFYAANEFFCQDDTEEMNDQLAYREFILNTEIGKTVLCNNSETCDFLRALSEKIFVPENASLVVLGNTNGLVKRRLRELLGCLGKI